MEVEVSVEAAWPTAPLAAELLEGFAEVGQGAAYLRALARHAELADAASWRQISAEAAEAENSQAQDRLFARFVSLQVRHATASARVEASRGLERADRDRFLAKGGTCSFGSPWALMSQPGEPVKSVCSNQALSDLASQLSSGQHPWLMDAHPEGARAAKDVDVQHSPLDHVLYSSESGHVDARKAIGYADLGSPEATASMLKALLSLAKVLEADQQPGYVAFRHGSSNVNTSTRAMLAGYGVNLLARSADEVTKSADGDSQASAASAQANSTISAEDACNLEMASTAKDPAEHFYGLDLEKIADLHPESKQALCTVRKDLQASAEAPVPPWELKYLGFHAATRVSRIARESGGLDGLAALEEVAQSFPSGWAHALASEGSGGEAVAQELLKIEEQFPGEGQLEINGWMVPKKKRGLLQLVHAHAPLFKAIEVLGQQGFKEAEIAEVLRDSRPGMRPPDRVLTPDPRISSDKEPSSPVIFDMRSDPETDDIRRQNQHDDRRMGMPGSQGPLIRLMQMYGRFWGYPPPVPRALLGIGFAIDPCNQRHVKFVVDEMSSQKHPAVVWLQLEAVAKDGERSPSTETSKIVSLLRGAIASLVEGKGGPPSARQFLQSWATREDADLCDAKASSVIKSSWEKASRSSGKLEPIEDDPSSKFAKLPVPSATVNGKVLFGEDLFDGFQQLCKTELQRVVVGISRGQVEVTSLDADIAKWQVGLDEGKSLLQVFHPVIKPGRGKYLPLAPSQLRRLPGGFVHKDGGSVPPIAPTVVHVLLFGQSASLSAVEEASHFLDAFANRALTLPSWRRWWVGFAVAGDCSTTAKAADAGSAPLSMAGAMRRCLTAVVPARTGSDTASWSEGEMDSASFSKRLQVVVSAWREAAKAKDGQDAAKVILDACASTAKSQGLSIDAGKFRAGSLRVDADDVSSCAAQHDSESTLGPVPSGAAVILANGRLHGPIFYDQAGVKFGAAHVAFTEEVELSYGHQLRGPTAKRLPWRDAPGGEEKQYPNAGAVDAFRRAGAGEDPLLLTFAMAARARAVEDAVVVREGGDSNEEGEEGDKAPAGRHIEEGDDEQGVSPLQKAFETMPDDLKLHVPHNPDLPCPLRIYAVIDPLSNDAQRLPPVLRLLHKELNAELHIMLRPQTLVVPPLTGYYRAAEAAPAPPGGLAALWQWDGTVQNARFVLPPRRNLLLSTLLHTPDAWHCSAVDSGGADLDSLLAVQGGVVRARYALEAMFVEGWATKASGAGWAPPAAGRHLALVPVGGTIDGEGMEGSHSVVVKSGYFQLRVPPGLYNLVLQGATDESLTLPKGLVELAALAGRGSSLEAQVGGSGSAKSNSASTAHGDSGSPSYEGAGGDRSRCKETIHIFSVASGHRYERLLRIMVLSVREHTKCPLRLWLVDNFLSPNFRRLLPALAAEVGFAVSRVTYKWPAWLREQTEKQRVIWAYKILFLDVFFPLQVKRVLFIDADQIVRADVKELWDIDLQGRVYGMVPFCGSGPSASSSWFGGSGDKNELRNPETVGLRFWEQGFWQSHLGSDKYYHISALFVVDLVLFRQVGAGDILRDVYQSLTADPHSLSNLDQDLPNYVQARQLPIFSLPPEWLWCETWCSESTKPKAKTIDMCQNPVRKEGKLQQARRIAPEWTKYDERLAAIIERTADATTS